MRPLDGITVVSLEQAVAAPFATRQLADLGARVIKVERLEGDFARRYDATVRGLSSHFVWTNRGKESLALNVKSDAGKAILQRLLDRADVFVHNLAPGAVERLGFAAARLRRELPRLIICAISGYGESGPYRDKKAYDLLIQAEAGLLSITGTAETPAKAGISVADIAGGMYAFSGVLTALLMRQQTGQGSLVEISLFEALAEWMGYPAYFTLYGGQPPARAGAEHATIAPYGPYATGDGHTVMLGIQNEREWGRFCRQVLGQPALAQDERFAGNGQRVAHRQALRQAIEAAFGALRQEEVVARLEAAQIAHAEMRSMPAFLEHPQLQARRRWRQVDSPAGPLRALLPPATIEGVEPGFRPIPALGQHTGPILSELGYSEAEVRRLAQEGVIARPATEDVVGWAGHDE